MNETDGIIQQTRNWVQSVVVKHNFCPFAAPVLRSDSLRIVVAAESNLESALAKIATECDVLESTPELETTLVVFPAGFTRFISFLDLSALASGLLDDLDYKGIYQVADFHPDYCFSGSGEDDPANYTNRSPWPMLHLIREASIERAIKHYPRPETIPETNINRCNELGIEHFQEALKECKLTETIDK